MSNCRVCGVNVPDGGGYCERCRGFFPDRYPDTEDQQKLDWQGILSAEKTGNDMEKWEKRINITALIVAAVIIYCGLAAFVYFVAKMGYFNDWRIVSITIFFFYAATSILIGAALRNQIIIGLFFLVTAVISLIFGLDPAQTGGTVCIGTLIFIVAILIIVGVLIILKKFDVVTDIYPWNM